MFWLEHGIKWYDTIASVGFSGQNLILYCPHKPPEPFPIYAHVCVFLGGPLLLCAAGGGGGVEEEFGHRDRLLVNLGVSGGG